MVPYFSEPNKTRYLILSLILINLPILLNLVPKDFGSIKVLYEMSKIKIFLRGFSSIKILSQSKSTD